MRALVLSSAILASACAATPERVGTLDVALTNVPDDAACVQLSVVAARASVRSFDLRAAQKASFSISGLPSGPVSVTANTFSAPCHQVRPGTAPSSYGEAVSALVQPSVTALAVLPQIHNGQAQLSRPLR